MPTPPRKGETQDHFVSRCISHLVSKEGKTSEQAAGQCHGMWQNRGKQESVQEAQEPAITKLYRNANLTPPKGRGLHTIAFHKCAIGYLKKGVAKDEAYKRCMGALGPEKAVKAGHRRESEMKLKTGDIQYDVNFQEATYDREKFKISNVAFLGAVSKNGWRYKESAMQKAVGLFEGIQLFVNHPSTEEEKTGRRDVRNLAGKGRNARFESGKIKGDLDLLPNDNGKLFMDIAKNMPESAGMSQNAHGRMKVENGEKTVEEITRVFSVDLVANPATNNGLFENYKEQKTMEYCDIEMNELRKKRPDIVQELGAEGQKSRDEEFGKVIEERDGFKTKVDEFDVREAQGKKQEKINKMLDESKLPKEAITDTFKENLAKIEDGEKFDEKVKEQIDDRKKLIGKGGVKGMGGEQKTKEGDGETPDEKKVDESFDE